MTSFSNYVSVLAAARTVEIRMLKPSSCQEARWTIARELPGVRMTRHTCVFDRRADKGHTGPLALRSERKPAPRNHCWRCSIGPSVDDGPGPRLSPSQPARPLGRFLDCFKTNDFPMGMETGMSNVTGTGADRWRTSDLPIGRLSVVGRESAGSWRERQR